MNIQFRAALGRSVSVIAGMVLLFAVVLDNGLVQAGQVQMRSIQMSDNGVSGGAITSGVGSGTNVSYRVTFRAASDYTLRGIVVDFCSGTNGTPFIGDSTCDKPTGFTVGSSPTFDPAGYTANGVSATGLGSGWSATSTGSGQTFKLTNSTGVSVANDGTTNYTFAITGVTNPSVSGSMYARLITYTSDSAGIGTYTHSSPGSYQDYGGFALSITNIVQVTAKVQETLVFCVLGSTDPVTPTAPTACNDSAATSPAITLGHGDNNTLDAFAIDKNYVYSYASTNALNGVTVRLHNANSCGGMRIEGTLTCGIPAVNAGAATTPSGAMTAGTAAFGVSIATNSDMVAQPPYDGNPANNYYGMDTTTVGANVTTTFGSQAIKSAGPVNNISNTWTFAATASATTAAGIYQANIAAIATGTF